MKLEQIIGKDITSSTILFVGDPTPSGVYNKDGEEYFLLTLKEEKMVKCSTEPLLEAVPVSEVYCLQSNVESDKWEGTLEDGYFIKGWVIDMSKNKEIPIYQAESIAKWRTEMRKVSKGERSTSFGEKMRKIREAAGKE